ncbi:hypothetical protein NC00_03495 [Xanthomonas cannabis pv. phaseoli]|uniref:Uncharacterized protein n=1 Tax=Xanthomonas cannabis pv. phaseoli TaxID=1885902 RepID=A0AB34PC54_9XANT|nr:hypothetical protein NC00_03495 [Xanthomonas cannabis pv. phaseoli]
MVFNINGEVVDVWIITHDSALPTMQTTSGIKGINKIAYRIECPEIQIFVAIRCNHLMQIIDVNDGISRGWLDTTS